MKIAFYTLGCKVNQYESQAMAELFKDRSHEIVNADQNPDVIVINSCSVTSESDRKTRQIFRKFKKNNPEIITVLTGCMVQAFPEKAKTLGADIVLGNTDQRNIADLLELFLNTNQPFFCVDPHETGEAFCDTKISGFEGRTRAFIKIQDGCDRFCSYCIIPYARGRVRSRSLESIKAEAERLASNGFKEVVLVGINLSAYGKGTNTELCDAVKAVSEVDGIKRIRLGSLEPDQISERTFSYLASDEKFCPQFHLSLQSGSDNTLRRMNRHYDSEFYRNLIKKIRDTFENPSITTDIMVGFAGETEEDFNDSLKFATEIGFAKAHVFAYSRRSGTRADKFDGQIENFKKSERSAKLISEMQKKEAQFHQSQIGKTVKVLFETEENGFYTGFSENYTKVKVKSTADLTAEILPVKITDAKADYCLGELV